MSAKRGVDFLRQYFASMSKVSNFQRVASKVNIISGGNGRCVGELTVEEEHENPQGTLHGGMIASLVDVVTSAALLTTEDGRPGVSVDLNVSYLSAAKGGETIVIDAEVVRGGKTLAYTTADIRRKSDGKIVALARHTKAFPSGNVFESKLSNNAMNTKRGVDFLRQYFASMANASNFKRVAAKVNIISGGNGRCVGELTVEKEHENDHGTLYAGVIACLVDVVTSAALLTSEDGRVGVSVDLNISYLSAAKGGETIVIDAAVVRGGKTLAYTTADIRRKSDGKIVALARHTKAFPPQKSKKVNCRFGLYAVSLHMRCVVMSVMMYVIHA